MLNFSLSPDSFKSACDQSSQKIKMGEESKKIGDVDMKSAAGRATSAGFCSFCCW